MENETILYFKDGEPVRCDIPLPDLLIIYRAVMLGFAEARIVVRMRVREVMLDVRYLDEGRTFYPLFHKEAV